MSQNFLTKWKGKKKKGIQISEKNVFSDINEISEKNIRNINSISMGIIETLIIMINIWSIQSFFLC